jgi:hypothetical protein
MLRGSFSGRSAPADPSLPFSGRKTDQKNSVIELKTRETPTERAKTCAS